MSQENMETDDSELPKSPLFEVDNRSESVEVSKINGDSEMEDVNTELQQGNRRCSLRPRKRSPVEISAAFEEFIQSPKKRRRKTKTHNHLETIFEEPVKHRSGKILLVGVSKTKRYITFSQFVTKAKLKKRKLKVKKMKLNKKTDKKKSETLREVEGRFDQLDI